MVPCMKHAPFVDMLFHHDNQIGANVLYLDDNYSKQVLDALKEHFGHKDFLQLLLEMYSDLTCVDMQLSLFTLPV